MMLQERLDISERRACAILAQHRSTQRHTPAELIRTKTCGIGWGCFVKKHPQWGYRRAHAVLGREGHVVKPKKIQRLWREEGLRVRPSAASATPR